MASRVARILAVGNVPDWVFELAPGAAERVPAPSASDASGTVRVESLIQLATERRSVPGHVLVVTDRDLSGNHCAAIFGLADRRAGVAVVSTARLVDPLDSGRTEDRLRNEIAHELGHLEGRAHCRSTGCVMHTVHTVEEIDARPAEACGRCPVSRSLGSSIARTAVALLVLGLTVLAIHPMMVGLFGPPFESPFT